MIRAYTIEKTLRTPVNFIVHSLHEVNDDLAHGRLFFMKIKKDGIALYEADDTDLHTPRPKTPEQALEAAREYFEDHYPGAIVWLNTSCDLAKQKRPKEAAFLLHQATERLSRTPERHRIHQAFGQDLSAAHTRHDSIGALRGREHTRSPSAEPFGGSIYISGNATDRAGIPRFPWIADHSQQAPGLQRQIRILRQGEWPTDRCNAAPLAGGSLSPKTICHTISTGCIPKARGRVCRVTVPLSRGPDR